jgi:serpin B
MYVILPAKTSSVSVMLDRLDSGTWRTQFLERVPRFPKKGTIALPRLKLEYGIDLKQPLTKLGLRRTFDHTAEFTDVSDPGIFVDRTLHKAVVEVNEEGTVAAASTVVAAPTLAIERGKPFNMIVDHPFFFAICDRPTGLILFLGIVQEPGA